jgi:hypothetical protein
VKVKAFAAVLTELAELIADQNAGIGIRRLVADLKPYARHELKGFFTLSSSPSNDSPKLEAMTVKQFAKVLGDASRLLKAGGASVKARELGEVANDLRPHGDAPVHELIDRVRAAQEAAKEDTIAGFKSRLNDLQGDREQFEKVLAELSKATPDIVGAVAVAYIQGKPKYASKPKALEAIRDKRYERARLASKMGERP